MSEHTEQSAVEALAVGTSVLAWPGSRDSAPLWTRTRSEPWQLGHGAWVVAVEGYAGGIALTHIERIPDGWLSPEQVAEHTRKAVDEARADLSKQALDLDAGCKRPCYCQNSQILRDTLREARARGGEDRG